MRKTFGIAHLKVKYPFFGFGVTFLKIRNMRIIPVLILMAFIIACNNSAKNKDKGKDTTSQPAQQPVKPLTNDTVFTGIGTEPFWAVYIIHDNKILFHPADGPEISVPFVTPTTPDAITTKYNSSNDSVTMELTIIKKNCSDGMSEIVHPYEVTLLINALRYKGCGHNKE